LPNRLCETWELCGSCDRLSLRHDCEVVKKRPETGELRRVLQGVFIERLLVCSIVEVPLTARIHCRPFTTSQAWQINGPERGIYGRRSMAVDVKSSLFCSKFCSLNRRNRIPDISPDWALDEI